MTYKDEMGPLPHSAKSLHGMHVMLEKSINWLTTRRVVIAPLSNGEGEDVTK